MIDDEKIERDERLQTSFMGDIREDVQFIGMNLADFMWIVGTTLLLGGCIFLLPLSFLVKMVWFIGVFLGIFTSRFIKWPYLRKRLFRYFRIKKEEDGKELAEILGMSEDGWLYRSGKTWQMIFAVQAPPWETAVSAEKRKRINSFGAFIRTAVNEGFDLDVQSEQVPDYRYELWDQIASRPAASEGIAQLKQNRLKAWQQTVHRGEAFRSEYMVTLTIHEFALRIHQRDDEPEGASKEELRRFRILAELRERMERVTEQLRQSGHSFTLLSGYAPAEIISRYWDRSAWMKWVEARGTWDEDEVPEPAIDLSFEESEPKRTWWKRRKAEPEQEDTPEEPMFLDEAVPEPTIPAGDAESDQEDIDTFKPPSILKRLLATLKQIIKEAFLCIRKGFRRKPKVEMLIEPADEIREDESKVTETEIPLSPVQLLTSPASSGKTFLAANVAVAYSSLDKPITLLDLSPDRGTLTVINPIKQIEDETGIWWTSRNVPGLTVWTVADGTFPSIPFIQNLIQERKEHGPVLVDIPWHYPGRSELLKEGVAVAIVDSDYHHWLQWEKEPKGWSGEVWLNQAEVDMQPLVEEHFQVPVTRRFPTFAEARRQLYLGRPLALEEEMAICFKGGIAHVDRDAKAS